MSTGKQRHWDARRFFHVGDRGWWLWMSAWVAIVFLSSWGGSRWCRAAEDWEPFLQGLAERGYTDMAIDYLETFRGAENCPSELKTDLELRISLLKLDQVRTLPLAAHSGLLSECQSAVEQWLSVNGGADRVWEAQGAIARIQTESARDILSSIGKTDTEATSTEKRNQAREKLEAAKTSYDEAVRTCGEVVERIQVEPDRKSDAVDRIRGSYLLLKIQAGSCFLDLAETWPEDRSERKEALTQARDAFDAIYQTYQNYSGGYTARFLQAKAERLLGQTEDSLGLIKELNLLPNEPSFFAVKTQSLLLLGEIAEEQKKSELTFYFLEKYYEWRNLAPLPSVYYRYTEGLSIQLIAGRQLLELAHQQKEDRAVYAKATREYFQEQNGPMSKILAVSSRLLDYAGTTLSFVASEEHDLSAEAETLLRDPLLSQTRGVPGTAEEGVDFGVAWRAADKSWNTWLRQAAEASSGDSPSGSESGSSSDASDTSELIGRIRVAIGLADPTEDRDKVNELYFREATAAWVERDWEDAAVLGDYLIRQTDCGRSAKAATYAIGALRRLASQAREAGAGEEELASLNRRVSEMAALIDTRFGNDRNADAQIAVDEAIMVQIETAVDALDLNRAAGLLTRIPETSPRRAEMELRYAQCLYTTWGTRSGSGEGESGTANESLLAEARKQYENALTRKLALGDSRAEDVTAVWGALSLAQICLTQNDSEEAWKWLSHPVIGPYNVIGQASAGNGDDGNVFPNPRFIQKTLLLALQVNVSLGHFDECQKIVSRLESEGGTDGDRLVAIYVQLGQELEKELKRLGTAAASGDVEKQKQLKVMTQGFEQFLDRISGKSDSASYATNRWVADTFLGLARGMAGTLSEVPKESVNYYTRAGRAYQSILKQIKANPSWCPDKNASVFCSVRLSECLRGTGRFDSAMKVLMPVLAANENNLELQIEAVRNYQDRGKEDKEDYVRAIVGGEPQKNARNLVWGWNRIISRLAGVLDQNERYREIYYDAWLNKLTCRYLYLRRLPEEEARTQAASAEAEILRLQQTHPDLGGPVTRRKFDDYLKRFRKQQEKTP